MGAGQGRLQNLGRSPAELRRRAATPPVRSEVGGVRSEAHYLFLRVLGISVVQLCRALLCLLPAGARRTLLRGGQMAFYTFQIVIEKEPDDEGYLAYSPTLPGCFSNGRTIEEAAQGIREAVQQHVEVLTEMGQMVPQRDSVVHVEQLSIAVP